MGRRPQQAFDPHRKAGVLLAIAVLAVWLISLGAVAAQTPVPRTGPLQGAPPVDQSAPPGTPAEGGVPSPSAPVTPPEETTPPPDGLRFPRLTGRVVDEAGLLSPAEQQSLDASLQQHEQATGNQVVVVTLRSLQGLPIEDYGYQLGRAWGIGRAGKNDGVLLIVAPTERKVRIEVGYGLEGALTDAQSRLIIEQVIRPAFRSGQFGPGIVAGTSAILKVLQAEAEGQPPPERLGAKAEVSEILPMLFVLAVFLVILWIGHRNRARSGYASPGSLRRRVGRGGMIGGSIGGLGGGLGGGWGGGGGGGGGFEGGGGSFGGGGASGDW